MKDTSVPECACHAPVLKVIVVPYISVYATPNKGQEARDVDARENRWHQDMPAYKAMRHQGLQPPRIDGCHVLARDAVDRLEVEVGRRIPKTDLAHAKEVKQELAESARDGSFPAAYREAIRGTA